MTESRQPIEFAHSFITDEARNGTLSQNQAAYTPGEILNAI